MTNDEIDNEVDLLKRAFPDLCSDAVSRALKDIDYMNLFPEDMVKERTSWDDLYSTVCDLEHGFSTLYDVVRRMACEKVKDLGA